MQAALPNAAHLSSRPFTRIAIPLDAAPVKLQFEGECPISDEAYWEFCQANPDVRVERSAEGEIVIAPPAGFEASNRNAQLTAQLLIWAAEDGRGTASDSSGQFKLPDGSSLSPDAAWVSNQALKKLTRLQKRKFLPLCPEFVIEVMSPTDRLIAAKRKMEQWIANGAQLAWLIDADHKTVYIYRPGHSVTIRRNIMELAGEGLVEGFTLKLRAIWKGLK